LAVEIKGRVLETTAHGNGPVNALDQGLRVVLQEKFGSKFSAMLVGYRVREVNSEAGTAAKVAVYVDFSDNHRTWTTVASSTNVLEASAQALVDGYAFALRMMKPKGRVVGDPSKRRCSSVRPTDETPHNIY
jgi:2-isopropylmalate synthase